eukprot:552450-Prymnesium_polylepis.2
MGVGWARVVPTLIGTTQATSHSMWRRGAGDGLSVAARNFQWRRGASGCHWKLRPRKMRAASSSALSGSPSSPPRKNRLCAASAAAQSTAPCGDERSKPAAAARARWRDHETHGGLPMVRALQRSAHSTTISTALLFLLHLHSLPLLLLLLRDDSAPHAVVVHRVDDGVHDVFETLPLILQFEGAVHHVVADHRSMRLLDGELL